MADANEQRVIELVRELGSSWGGEGCDVQRGGRAFSISVSRHKRRVVNLHLLLELADAPKVLLRKESGIDRLGKRLGLNREFQSGDSTFDESVYVETEVTDEVLLALVRSETFRSAIRLTLQAGVEQIELGPHGLKLTLPRSRIPALTLGAVEEFLDALALMADGIPAEVRTAGLPLRRSPGWPAIIAAGVLLVVGGVSVAVAGSRYEPLDGGPFGTGAGLGVLAVLLATPLYVRHLRGHSDSFRKFIILTLLLLIALPLCGMAIAVGGNGLLDVSPPVAHPTCVLRKYTTRSKNSTSYHLEIQSWRAGEPFIHLRVSSNLYNRASPGSPITLTTRAGYWHWEWIHSYQ